MPGKSSIVWYGVTKADVEQLEQINQMWMRNLFECSLYHFLTSIAVQHKRQVKENHIDNLMHMSAE